ncbi:hypothetical protein ID866_4371 [Astraeus odoratus]|nr:hypothetical protein ID866_4371 [Astraeus odoratus]
MYVFLCYYYDLFQKPFKQRATAKSRANSCRHFKESTHFNPSLRTAHTTAYSERTSLPKPKVNSYTPNPDGDARRNLYVLGLPFDLTKVEFAQMFAPFGTVTHAVILATVDGASRRRGFVVMSTHEEACAAMKGLSRNQIKGHTLDISWAVVQRSQGFLDGGDRGVILPATMPSSLAFHRTESTESESLLNSRWRISQSPTTKLLVSNLSAFLFTQICDLQPLFLPFGAIKKMGFLHPSHASINGSIEAIVEYIDVSSAQEARHSLQFQTYAGYSIEVHYVLDDILIMDNHTICSRASLEAMDARLHPSFPLNRSSSRSNIMQGLQSHFGYRAGLDNSIDPLRHTSYSDQCGPFLSFNRTNSTPFLVTPSNSLPMH